MKCSNKRNAGSSQLYIVVVFTLLVLHCDGFIASVFTRLKRTPAKLHNNAQTNTETQSKDNKDILRKVDKWACIKSCGACCKLGPLESRPDLKSYLTKAEYNKYQSMIDPDDWCKNFDQNTRMCTIYDTRPDFCRVEPKKFQKMFGIEESELNDFCTFCCTEQIGDVYGESSDEMRRFNGVIESLS